MEQALARSATRVRGFADPEFDFQLLRSLGAVAYGGGAVGEIMSVAGALAEPTPQAWTERFGGLADMVAAEAERCRQAGRMVSARDLWLRASMYYRAAEYFADLDEPRHDELGLASRDCFVRAGALLDAPVTPIAVPWEPLPLPGYLMAAAGERRPRKTMIVQGGFDSSAEELYFQCGVEALKRGWNVVFFDGPGQTGMMRLRPRLGFRPDWQAVLGAVVDWALARPEVDHRRLALVGISFGGFLASKGAAHDGRIKAYVANSPVPDWFAYLSSFWPEQMLKAPDFGVEDVRGFAERLASPRQKQMLVHVMRKFGASGWHDFLARLDHYRMSDGELAAIACPVLACVGQGEGGEPLAQFERFAAKVSGPVTRHVFEAAWGADGHCQVGNLARFGQVACDWLDAVLA